MKSMGPQMGYHQAPHELGFQQNGQDTPPPYDDEHPQPYGGGESDGNYNGSGGLAFRSEVV